MPVPSLTVPARARARTGVNLIAIEILRVIKTGRIAGVIAAFQPAVYVYRDYS